MTTAQFDTLQKLNNYLKERQVAGIKAFKVLLEQVKKESFDLIGLSFTYENVEVIARKNGKDQYLTPFVGILSQAEIDELTYLEFSEDNFLDDYTYHMVLLEMTQKMIEQWLMTCFHQANISEKNPIPIYFKSNFDSMEILDLENGKTLYEKSEFDTFYNLNKDKNTMELFPVG